MKKIIIIALCLLAAIFAIQPKVYASEANLKSVSKQALLMDYASGEILYEHDSTTARPIASMVKLMTLLCIYESIDEGIITLQDDVTVSQTAASMGGSQVFLDADSVHKAENLIKTIIICSANDSCVAMAEHVSGSVEAFVDKMNDKAAQLCLVNTNFVNCTGLPAVNQFSCAQDVAVMMRALLKHENYYKHASIWLEDYVHPNGRTTTITNTNKLSRFYKGCDGGKTGFTQEAMHCLCATAIRDNSRYIAVVVGAPDSKTRFNEVSNMLNFAFANYQSKTFYKAGETVGELPVLKGKKDTVEYATAQDLVFLMRKGSKAPEIKIELSDSLVAPCQKGDIIGKAYLVLDGNVVAQADIVILQSVGIKSYLDCIRDILKAG